MFLTSDHSLKTSKSLINVSWLKEEGNVTVSSDIKKAKREKKLTEYDK